MAEEQREQKKGTGGTWSGEWAAMSPWKSHWNFELDQIDFWVESVPCSNCDYVGTRRQMYVGRKQRVMWCSRCDRTMGTTNELCFVDIAEGKYENVPAWYFWRWIEWLNNRGVDERDLGPGLGADKYALGPNWNVEVFEKTENAASQKCLGKSAK